MNNNFKNNIAALTKKSQHIKDWVDSQKEIDWATMTKSKNNDWNMLIKNRNQVDCAYDINTPRKELRQVVKNLRFYKQNVTVIIGAGVGHLLKMTLDKKEKEHRIVLIEPVATILKFAFQAYDFSKWIEDETLIIIDDNPSVIPQVLGFIDNVHVVEDWVLLVEKYCMVRPEYVDSVKMTSEAINQLRCNTGTVMGAGAIIAANDILNIPYCIRNKGINEIRDLHKNKPCVLVSTGPSLLKNIHILKEMKDKVIIIAVAQALRILLAYDIRPDFICTVDYGKVNYEHFDGLMDCDVPLIALNRSYAPILKRWSGTKFVVVSPQPGYEDSATGIMTRKGHLEHGGSVAHMCLGTAMHLGCDPIIFVGQDLSYDTNRSHANGADASGEIMVDQNGMIQWVITDPRSSLKKVLYPMGPAQYVPSFWGGEKVLTNLGLASFITSFEAMIERHPEKLIINATEGGVRLKGAEHMTLCSVEDKYCKKTLDKSEIENYFGLADDYEDLIDEMIPALKKDICTLDQIIDNTTKGLKTATQLKKEGLEEKELNKLLKENAKYSNAAHDAAKKNSLVGVAIFSASRAIHSREMNLEGKKNNIVKDRDALLKRIERNELILNKAKDESTKLKKYYQKTLGLLKVYKSTNNENCLISHRKEKVSFKDAHIYFKDGNWMHPLLDARKVLENHIPGEKKTALEIEATKVQEIALKARSEQINNIIREYKDRSSELEYNNLIEKSKTLGRDHQNYKESLKLLKRANNLCPDKVEAKWGLATTYHFLKMTDESLYYFEELMKDYPDDLKFKFEYGNVMLMKDIQKGLKIIGEVMESTDKFDSHLAAIGMLYQKAKMYEEAVVAFDEYLKSHEMDYTIWEKLGDCYKELGEEKKAASSYKRSSKIKGA